jgi:hypothetical protein
MAYRKQKMFALRWASDNRGRHVSCVRHQARDVRQEVGQTWSFGEGAEAGWKRAKKRGARVVPVWISLKP